MPLRFCSTRTRYAAVLVTLLAASAAAMSCRSARPTKVPDLQAPAVVVPVTARTSLALTLYALGSSSGYAFVREERKVRVPAGHFQLRAEGVASGIVPETTRFELVTLDEDGKVDRTEELYEQRFLYDRLSSERLLEKAVGQRVRVVYPAGARSGKEAEFVGVLLASKDGTLVRRDSGEVTGLPEMARVYFDTIPSGLVQRPTLSWMAGAFEDADALLRFSYRADRFKWQADYVVALDSRGTLADVEGWITVVNGGDTSFEKAKLQLVAGTVHTVDRREPPRRVSFKMKRAMGAKVAESAPMTREENLGDLHLYSINELSDLPARSSKQVRFTVARGVPVVVESEAKTALEDGNPTSHLTLKLEHKEGTPLAVALPAGHVRTSATASQGQSAMVGEGSTEHSPVGEAWRVPVAQDLAQVTRVRVKERSLVGRDSSGQALRRVSMQMELRNTGDRSSHRRVVVEPDAHVLMSVSGSPLARREGPKRMVVEMDLASGASKTLDLVIEYADPSDVRRPGSDEATSPEAPSEE